MAVPEIRLMRAAIALAEELSFSRAAQRLHLTQPAITKQIAELEDFLGFALFQRDHQAVVVTDAGRAFVEEARIAVLHGERAVQAARAAMSNAEATLNVGRSPYTDPFLTSTLLSIQLPLYPQLRIELTSQYSYDLVHELLAGALDLAIVNQPPESPKLTTTMVAESPFYIAMSKQDQLAGWPSVKLDAMADRSWILFERRLHPPLYDEVMRVAEAKRVAPARIQHITTPEESFHSVADGSAIAFLLKPGALLMARNGITIRPLAEETLSLKTCLAARADNKSKVVSELVRAFVRKLSNMAESNQLSLPLPVQAPRPATSS